MMDQRYPRRPEIDLVIPSDVVELHEDVQGQGLTPFAIWFGVRREEA